MVYHHLEMLLWESIYYALAVLVHASARVRFPKSTTLSSISQSSHIPPPNVRNTRLSICLTQSQIVNSWYFRLTICYVIDLFHLFHLHLFHTQPISPVSTWTYFKIVPISSISSKTGKIVTFWNRSNSEIGHHLFQNPRVLLTCIILESW